MNPIRRLIELEKSWIANWATDVVINTCDNMIHILKRFLVGDGADQSVVFQSGFFQMSEYQVMLL